MSSTYYDRIFEQMKLMSQLAKCEEQLNNLNLAERRISAKESELAPFKGALIAIEDALDNRSYGTIAEYAESLDKADLPQIKQKLKNLGLAPVSDSNLKREVDAFLYKAYNSYRPDQLSRIIDECMEYHGRINCSNRDINTKKKELIKKLIIGVLIAVAAGLLIWFIAANPWILLIPVAIGVIALVIKIKND